MLSNTCKFGNALDAKSTRPTSSQVMYANPLYLMSMTLLEACWWVL